MPCVWASVFALVAPPRSPSTHLRNRMSMARARAARRTLRCAAVSVSDRTRVVRWCHGSTLDVDTPGLNRNRPPPPHSKDRPRCRHPSGPAHPPPPQPRLATGAGAPFRIFLCDLFRAVFVSGTDGWMAKEHNANDLASDGGRMSIRSKSKVTTGYRHPMLEAAAVRTATEPNDVEGMHRYCAQSIERTRESQTEPFDSPSSQETYAKHAIMGISGG